MKSHWHKISHMWQYNGNFRESKKRIMSSLALLIFTVNVFCHCNWFPMLLTAFCYHKTITKIAVKWYNLIGSGELYVRASLQLDLCIDLLRSQKGPLNPSQSLWLAHANAHYSLNRKPHSLNIIMPANLYSFLPRVRLEIF